MSHSEPVPALSAQPTAALLRGLVEHGRTVPLSFEVFPPRSSEGRRALEETVDRLASAADDGFSVTMGAGGSTRIGTHETCRAIAERTGRPVMAHLTALGLSRDEALATADGFWDAGIRHLLALRGDPPRDAHGPLPPGFAHAAELVAALKARHDFDVTVAAYPEKHPEAETLDVDIEHLEEKLDAGARRAICQFVLNPEAYGRFVDACARRGIDAPIVPGLMPLDDWTRVRRFARTIGARVPDWLDRLLAPAEESPELAPLLGMVVTLEQARRLIAYGAPALHVYALNRWPIPLALARCLGRGA